jgi:transcriptional regulator with XRE-family HTH domain
VNHYRGFRRGLGHQPALRAASALVLSEMRRATAMPVDVLAERAGIDPVLIREVEAGRRVPELCALRQLAPALGTSYTDLLCRIAAEVDAYEAGDQRVVAHLGGAQ